LPLVLGLSEWCYKLQGVMESSDTLREATTMS